MSPTGSSSLKMLIFLKYHDLCSCTTKMNAQYMANEGQKNALLINKPKHVQTFNGEQNKQRSTGIV